MKAKIRTYQAIGYVLSFLVGFTTVIFTFNTILKPRGNSQYSLILGLGLLFFLALISAFIAYRIFKFSFKTERTLVSHSCLGCCATTLTVLLVSFSLFLLSSIENNLNVNMESLILYLFVFLITGFIYSLPGIMISGLLLGYVNFKINNLRLRS